MVSHSDRCDLALIELEGSPRRMGEQFGEACREEIRELFVRRLRGAIDFALLHGQGEPSPDSVLRLAAACLPASEGYDPDGYDEFLGIARGAGLSAEELFIVNGVTDLRDILICAGAGPVTSSADEEGCSAFVVTRDCSASGRLLAGQNWDLAADNMPFVRLVHRRPDSSPETISLTLTGCLSLIGLNSEGVAVGTTNISTSDARPGVQYLSLIHRALGCRSAGQAATAIEQAQRAAAHFYYLADSGGNALGLECSATRSRRFQVKQGTFVRCNHALAHEIQQIEFPPLTASSACRHRRLDQLLQSQAEPLTVARLKRFLGDHDGGENAICRHATPPHDMSTNASVIMSPETGEIHACRAQPHVGAWQTRGF
jgi:isopenicillin-N N-acyltransferase like protein